MDLPLKKTVLVTEDLVGVFIQLVDQVKLSPGQPGAVESMARLAELREEAVKVLSPPAEEVASDE